MQFLTVGCLLVLFVSAGARASFINGSVRSSSGAFGKILKAARLALVKFDDVYPHGEKHDEFKKVAEASMKHADWLCVEIGVADYGDKENMDLAERYAVKKDEFPAYFLFKNGNTENPIRYKGPIKADDLKSFVAREGGLYIGLNGCIESLDLLAARFVRGDASARQTVLSETQAAVAKLSDAEKESGEFYIKVMQKALEKPTFIGDELSRITRLKDGKVSDTKRAQMSTRSNILTVFHNAAVKEKDEL